MTPTLVFWWLIFITTAIGFPPGEPTDFVSSFRYVATVIGLIGATVCQLIAVVRWAKGDW